MPFLICFSLLKINGICAEALALDSAFSGFIPFFDVGLNGNSSLFIDDDFYENKLPLELSTTELESINENYYLDEATEQSKPIVWNILSGGASIPGQSLFARTLTNSIYGNTKAFVLGVKDNLSDTIQTASNKAVFWWNRTFSNSLNNAKQALEQVGEIVNLSNTPNAVTDKINWTYSSINYDIQCLDKSYNPAQIIIYQYRSGEAGAFIPADYVYSGSDRMGAVGTTKINGSEFNIDSIYTDGAVTQIIRGRTYYYGKLYQHWDGGGNSIALNDGYSDYQSTLQFLQNYDPYANNGNIAYDYAQETISGTSVDIMQLLSRLEGHWIDTDSASRVRDILDGGIVIPDTQTGTSTWTLTDELVAELTDVIDDILDQSRTLEDELGVIADSGTADPNDPSDDQDYFDTGIKVPDDFPDSSFDTVNDIISSPLQFFSIFEPIFMIFGANTLMIFSLWLFVPCVIIIAFIIWALK